jgi:glutamate--cysteine ligase
LDLDPFIPTGIDARTMRFLDIFLLHCLVSESPPDSPAEIAALGRNQHRTAAHGREPGLRLERDGGEIDLTAWGAELLAGCAPIARTLDGALGGTAYGEALQHAAAALRDLPSLPSARMLEAITRDFDRSYTRFIVAQSQQTKNTMLERPLLAQEEARFLAIARESVEAQHRIEEADTMPFEIYRQTYVAPERLQVRSAAR